MRVTLNLIDIRVTDLEASLRFYEALGLRFSLERHTDGPEHLAVELSGTVFETYPRGNAASTSGVRLGFRVPSVSAAVAALESAGGKISSRPAETPWGLRAVAVDPDGHRVEISE